MAAIDSAVRAAAEAYMESLPGATPGKLASAHSEAVSLGVAGSALIVDPTIREVGKVISVLVLHAGNAAIAHVSFSSRAGWLTLLVQDGAWVVISSVTSEMAGTTTPADMAAAVGACWDEYCGANRACDGPRMANIFHPQCRLTYTDPNGSVVIKTHDAFVQMVSERYALPLHAPYAHLRDDRRVAAQDNLLGIHFATPDVCMVILKVGHPPMLWTDVLTCARLGERWWILAKSSCSEPLLADEAQKS